MLAITVLIPIFQWFQFKQQPTTILFNEIPNTVKKAYISVNWAASMSMLIHRSRNIRVKVEQQTYFLGLGLLA